MQEQDLKRKTVLNVSYNATGRATIVFVQLISNVVLARTLLPGDFGIVGFANIIVGLLWAFNEFGVNTAITQKANLERTDLYTGVTIKFGIGLLTTCIALMMAPLAHLFFDSAEVVNVIRALSVNFILAGFCFIPGVLMARELEYKKITLINVISAALGASISILMAISGYGYWSIVISAIIVSVVNVFLYNIFKPFPIRFQYDYIAAKATLVFGGSVFLSKVVMHVLFNSDNFAIGSLKGANELGYYALAFNWGAFVSILSGSVVLSVLFPTFSNIQEKRDKIRGGYLKVIEYVALFGTVSYVTLFVVGREFLTGILGGGTDKWLQSLNCLRIFCAYGLIRILLEPIGSVCLAIGRPGTMLRANVLAASVQIAFVYPALKTFGIEGVAILVTVAYGLQYVVYIKETFDQIGLELSDVVRRVLPSFILLPLASLAILDKFHQYTMLWLITKATFTLASCIILHGLITKWRLEKDIGVLLFRKERVY
jgi:lipopolysaccharide exporter